MTNLATITFDVEYEPLVAGGPPGVPGSEVYPLRCDAHGTHQLSHYAMGTCSGAAEHTTIFGVKRTHHQFSVQIDARRDGQLFMPYHAAGAYDKPIDVGVLESSASGSVTVANSTTVILYFYATTFSESGQACWSYAGTALLSVVTLMHLGKTAREFITEVVQNRDNDAQTDVNHALIKGHVRITNVRTSNIRVRALTDYDIDVDDARMSRAARIMNRVIDRGMNAYFGHPARAGANAGAFLTQPTRPFLVPFHCPEFRTERMPLPASAYAMLMPSGELDVPYFEGLINVALLRSAMTRAEARELAEHAAELTGTLHQRAAFASFAVRAMSAFAVSQCYVSDFMNRNVEGRSPDSSLLENNEDFKICRLCGGDDCEGVGLEVHMHVRQLCRASNQSVARMSPLLQAVRAHLRLYVSCLVLGAVTNKKLTAAELDQNAVLAHTYAVMIPYWQFYYASAAPVRQYLQDSKFYRERAAELAPFATRADEPLSLTALIGEGTAPIDPAMRPVTRYYEPNSRELLQALSVARARRDYTNDVVAVLANERVGSVDIEVFGAPDTSASDYSPFYKYSVSLATPEFGATRTFDWALVYNRDSPTDCTVGVRIEDLLDPGREPRAEIIPFVDMTETECRTADAILLDQEPVPVLRAIDSDWSENQRLTPAGELCERLRQSGVDQVTGVAAPVSGTALHRRQTFLTVREQDVTDAVARALLAITALSKTRRATFARHILNASVCGDLNDNRVIDLYLEF